MRYVALIVIVMGCCYSETKEELRIEQKKFNVAYYSGYNAGQIGVLEIGTMCYPDAINKEAVLNAIVKAMNKLELTIDYRGIIDENSNQFEIIEHDAYINNVKLAIKLTDSIGGFEQKWPKLRMVIDTIQTIP